jgi:hypothetical protein
MTRKISLDALLSKAAQLGVIKNDEVDVDPVAVPDALRRRVMTQARSHTGHLLAAAIVDAAARHGKSKDDVVAGVLEAAQGQRGPDVRRRLASLLNGEGDVRKVGPELVARTLAVAHADAAKTRELIVQLVSQLQFAEIKQRQRRGLRGVQFAGLKKPAPSPSSDEARRARQTGEAFAEEVLKELSRLDDSGAGG